MSMSLLLQFIGLVTLVSGPGQPMHILVPRFPNLTSNQAIIIPISMIDQNKTHWQHKIVGDTWWFDTGNRTISFAATNPFEPGIGDLPHLTCCCAAMDNGLKPIYNDLDSTKRVQAAYVKLDRGKLTSQTDPVSTARYMQLQLDAVNGAFTITGSRANQPDDEIFFTIPANNTALTLSNEPTTNDHDSHWKAYYQMGIGASSCNATPKNDPACKPKPNGCLTESAASAKPATTAKAAPQPKSSAAAPKSSAKAAPKSATPTHASTAGHRGTILVTDINCSNSQWP